jgi:hypothetical protein
MECLESAGIDLVLSSEDFSEEDLRNFQMRLRPNNLAKRLMLGPPTEGDRRKVLITVRQASPNLGSFESPEPWAGVLILPIQRPYAERVLRPIFAVHQTFQNGIRGRRVLIKGVLSPFVLDLRARSPLLYGVPGTQRAHSHPK